jgi:LPXTG-site transpeptidase (sortase) family protein
MKQKRAILLSMTLIVTLLGSLVGQVTPAYATTVSGNVFLQGTYAEIGIGPNGTFGTLVAAPAGFHQHSAGGNIGFVADYQKDGWAVGSPNYGGDYFVPGTPWEGFGIECTGGAAQNGGGSPSGPITPVSLVEGAPGPLLTADWVGTVSICGSTMQVTHHYYMDPTWAYVMVDTTITNTGGASVTALSFGRGVDPDNDQTWPGGNYTTRNEVISQPGSIPNPASTRAIVSAYGIAYPDMGLFLGTNDTRGRANASLPSFAMYNTQTLTAPTVGPLTADNAMQIAFDLGTLNAGSSVTVTYYYGFNASDITTPAPTLTGLTPPTGPIAGGTVVTITGTNLTGATFTFDGLPAVCTVNPAGTSATCTTPPHTVGPVDVVANTVGGAATLVGAFTFVGAVAPAALPATGFAPDRLTALPAQTIAYAASDLWLEIPRLGVKMDIVGVPQSGNTWDVSWLGKNAGWLQGTAFPTWDGNSVITGHVWNADNTAGPFVYLNTLWYGDRIIVHAWGQQYTYEVRSVMQVRPDSTSAAFQHKDTPWLTLTTCRSWDANSGTYRYRVLVQAALVNVK